MYKYEERAIELDYANYFAIRILEKLGVSSAVQQQIDSVEKIVLEAMQIRELLLTATNKRQVVGLA